MRARADRAPVATLVLALLLSACTDLAPMPTGDPPQTGGTPSVEPASPTPEATRTASPTPVGIDVPAPARPWDGATLLEEMRRSTRPGGVPQQLQTPELAAAVADRIWTVDGAAWDTFAIGGFCGTSTCTLDVAGTHLGRAGEDLWTLEIDPATGSVDPLVAEVRSLPPDLVQELDRLARGLEGGDALEGMVLTTATWLPPPADGGRFELSYRTGGEEGSCAREVLLDATGGEIVSVDASGC